MTLYISLQVRLTCLSIVLLSMGLWLFGSLVLEEASQRAYRDLDASLSSRAASVKLGKFFANQQALPALIPGIAGVESEGIAIEILDAQQRLLATTDSHPADPVQSPLYLEGAKSSPVPWDRRAFQSMTRQKIGEASQATGIFSSVVVQGQTVRVYTLATMNMEEQHIIQTARSIQPVEQSLNQLRLILFGGGMLVLICTSLGGWLITREVLNRVQRITLTAQSISQKRSLQQRIPVQGWSSQDELSLLALTFNTMLDELEQLYAYQQRFLADASHELRAPITSIRCNLDLLTRAPYLPSEEAHAALLDAQAEAERMGRLVNDLLTLAHADAQQTSTHKQLVDLDSLFLEVFRQYRPKQENGEQSENRRQGRLLLQDISPVRVMGDSDQLKQVLVALIDNALKYSEGSVVLSLVSDRGMAIISIKDQGIGISPAEMPAIFERFYRSPRTRKQSGSGLGLAIVRSILQEHQGSIEVESVPDQGSTFKIAIPLLKEADQGENVEEIPRILET